MAKTESGPQHHDYVELSMQLDDDEPPDDLEKNQQTMSLLTSDERHGCSSNAYFEETHKESKKHQESLALQAFPSLIISMVGLVFAGHLMDEFQHWKIFIKTSELFILLPILLNLKGNLEMNLAARFSTSSNLGELDHGATRRSLILGNLCLLQVQSIVAGALAGVASFALGLITKPGSSTSYYEMMYVTANAMVSASFSAAILGVFMCVLIVLCRKLDVDPDNIACPMASSTGDIVTLILMAACAYLFEKPMETFLCTIVVCIMLAMIPIFGLVVWKNKHVKDLLFTGWTPIIFAMVISSLAGIMLEQYVEKYRGIALLTPVLIGLSGNLGSIYASRISTCLHSETKENYRQVENVLLMMDLPVQAAYMFIIWVFNLGQLHYNFWFFVSFFLVSMLSAWISLKIGKYMTLAFWKMGYDPDNYVIPYLTACIDVIGTILLVASFAGLTNSGATDMAMTSRAHNHS
ncbi:hypothetical protein BY458DRAFT_74892 [Sporodiniella umbellata]|nr:hypothetical protein BY458DRAFT_74892 [Sporodiniella umbellata]